MGLWKFLKWTFQKRDTTSGEDFALWLEIWQALSVQKGSQKKNRNYL